MTRKRTTLLLVGTILLVVGATLFVLRESGAARILIEQALQRIVRCEFRLAGADLDLERGTVRLLDLLVRDPRTQRSLLAVRDLSLDVDTNPLGEIGAIHQVRITGMQLAIHLAPGQRPRLDELLRLDRLLPADSARSGRGLPGLLVTDSRIRIHLTPDGDPLEFTDVQLELLPTEVNGTHRILSGSMRTSFGCKIAVRGSGDLAKREFRLLAEAEDLPVTHALARAIHPQVAEYLRLADVAGRITKLSCWAEYPVPPGEDDSGFGIALGASCTLDRIRCEAPDLPYPFRDAKAKVTASLAQQGQARFTLEETGARGIVSAGGDFSHLLTGLPLADVRLSCKDIVVDATLAKVVQSQEPGRDVWQAFAPHGGKADAEIRLWIDEPGENPDFAMDLHLRGVAARFEGFEPRAGARKVRFPWPLANLHGEVQVRPGTLISIHDLHAEAEQSQLVVNGRITTRRGGETGTWIDVDAKNLPFSPDLRAALSELEPEIALHWDEYTPVGRADANIRVRSTPEAAEPEVLVQIAPREASASFAGFPLRIDAITGKVAISSREGVTLDLTGRHGAATIEVDGRFHDRPDAPDPLRSELFLRGKNLEFTPPLHAALRVLDPDLDAVWQRFAPRGHCDCEVVLWRPRGQELFTYDTRIDLRRATAVVQPLALPLDELTGPVILHGTGKQTQIEIDLVRGRVVSGPAAAPARLLVHGSGTTDGTSISLDVTSIVRGLPLVRPLAEALDRSNTFSLATWDLLRPEGTVDVVHRLSQESGEPEPRQHLRLRLENVTSRAAVLPYPATQLAGEVVAVDNEARFARLSANIGSAQVLVTDGLVRQRQDGNLVEVKVTADAFPVDRNLANLFTGPLREAYLDRGMRGTLHVHELVLALFFPAGRDDFETRFSGRFEAVDVQMSLGADVQRLHGLCSVDHAEIGATSGLVTGTLHDLRFEVFDHPIVDLTAGFRADTEAVAFHALRLRLHRGILESARADVPALRYEYAPSEKAEVHARLTGMSLAEFLSAGGQMSSYRGTVGGTIDIDEVRGADFVNMRGRTNLVITDGRLGDVPLFQAIYRQLPEDRRPKFEGVEVSLEAADQRIRIDRLLLSSPLLAVEGQGTATMDGYLDLALEFPNLFGSASKTLVVPEILRRLTNAVVSTQIYGYLRDPRSRQVFWLSGSPESRPLEPIPSRLPQRAPKRF